MLTGPESSGKTTLAKDLAVHWSAPLVTEYAREYLQHRGGLYEEEDLLTIAKAQFEAERLQLTDRPELCICDTDLLVLEIWSEWKYGRCNPWIKQTLKRFPGDLYLLCHPGIPWEHDPLREHPDQRAQLYALYRYKLDLYGFRYLEISGDKAARLLLSNAFIAKLLSTSFLL